MNKKNQISVKLENGIEPSTQEPSWPTEQETSRSPSLPFSHYQKRQRKQKSNWGNSSRSRSQRSRRSRVSPRLKSSSKLILTIGSAIGLGLLMGMMVLNIFSNLNEEPTAALPSINGEQEVGKTGEEKDILLNEGEEPTLIPNGTIEGNSVHLPTRSYYVVQAGAFTEKAMADEGLSQQLQQGWAGLLLGDEAPYRLYAGLAGSKEEAILLGQFYRDKNMDIYIKEHQTKAVTGSVIQLNEETLAKLPSFLSKGDMLLGKMSAISAKGIMNPSEALEASGWKEMQELHRSFLQEGQALFGSWPEYGKAEGERLMHQLTEGMNVLDAYYKQKHVSYLWKVQQALLDYVEAYEQFMATFASAA